MKKILMMVMVVAAAMSAKADLLYFMANAFDWDGPDYFDFAMVGVADATTEQNVGYLYIQSSPDSSADASIFRATDNGDRYHATGFADFGEYKTGDYVFYVETYSNDSEDPVVAYSKETAKSYEQLKAAGYVYIPGSTDPLTSSVGSAWVVPEPSSGLLLLLGLAGLALKRKNK